MRCAAACFLAVLGICGQRALNVRRRAEGQLALQKALLEAQAEAAVDGILVVDEAGKIISFNQRFAEMWRVPQEVLDTASDEEGLRHVQGQLRDPKQFLRRAEYLYAHPDETSRDEIALADGRTFERYSAPVGGPSREYVGRVWYFRDITERKRMEEELRESEERHKALLEGAAQGVLVADAETKALRFANPAICRMLGYTEDELTRMSVREIHPQDAWEHVLSEFEAQARGEKTLAPRRYGRVCRCQYSRGPAWWKAASCGLLRGHHGAEGSRAADPAGDGQAVGHDLRHGGRGRVRRCRHLRGRTQCR